MYDVNVYTLKVAISFQLSPNCLYTLSLGKIKDRILYEGKPFHNYETYIAFIKHDLYLY